ncbi:MAG: efflux RND transporter periplasmic adaptor subunit [Thermodesulfobacteriota bacterium]|nr:efflux RND transporter periplasmic adaptor subunit [Thermodesulfobacteriota bacterium]
MSKTKRRLLHVVITVGLIGLGALGMRELTASKPEIQKRKPSAPIPLVRTTKVKAGPQSVTVQGEGTVRPLQEIQLVPEVNGKVVYVSTALVDGGQFKKDDVLLRIDPADYHLAVTLAQAKVKDAESALQLAEEEAAAAAEEWRMLYGAQLEAELKPPPLVAKEPQLAAAQAKLEGDKADLKKALLNLERTELAAPFHGRVSTENVDLGQYVSSGQSLATLYSTEGAEIVVPLEDESLLWFHVPGFTDGQGPGSTANVRARIAGRELLWNGQVVRAEGKLDERTRMINVIVRVDEPYATRPPLAMGLFVTVDIEGRQLPKAAIIPRRALHEEEVVWTVDEEDRLRFRKVDVARIQGDEVVVEAGLEDGERVVVTPLKAVTDGMAVRTLPEEKDSPS